MRRWTLCAAAALLLACLPALAGPVAAQDHLFSFTGYFGSAAYGDLTAGEDPGVLLAPGGFYGLQTELWIGRFGARVHAGFAGTDLENDPGTGFDIVAIDADFLARLRRPRPAQFFQPYGVLGFGAVRYTTGTDATTVAGYDYGRDPENRASVVLGIGADFLGGPTAIRLELMDIIGFSSPLSRGDGSAYGPVSHVVLTFGLSFRVGRVRLSPEPEATPRPRPRPPTNQPETGQPADTVAGPPGDTVGETTDTLPADTIPADTTPADTAPRVKPPPPTPPPVDTTVSVDSTKQPPRGLRPEAPDTVRVPPRQPPTDTAGPPIPRPQPPPVDTTVSVDTTKPPPTPTPPPVDTTATVDTTAPPRRPPRDSMLAPPREEQPQPPRRGPPTGPPTDTTYAPTDTADAPTDTTGTPTDTTGTPTDTTEVPTDTTDTDDEVRGRLFTVRVSWDADHDDQADAMAALLAALEEADVPVWPPEDGDEDDDPSLTHRRVAALRNAADARTLGNHVQAEYGLAWEWVHIDRDEDVPAEDVEASTAFVDGLPQGPGNGGQGGPPG